MDKHGAYIHCNDIKNNLERRQAATRNKFMYSQGSKKVPSHCPGQVDFPSGQVTLHSHLPNGQETKQVICQLNH